MSDELLRRLDSANTASGNLCGEAAARIRALEADYAQAIFALEQSESAYTKLKYRFEELLK